MSSARVVLAAGLVVLAQLLDVTVLARTHWPLATPDLTLLVVVALALLGGSRSGATVGLAAGLVADLTPPGAGLLGLTAVAYGLAGLVAGRYHRPGERSLVLVLVAAAAAGATSSVVLAVAALGSGDSLARALEAVVGGVGYAVVAALLVVPLVIVLDRWVEGEPVEVARL
ncbi:MAG: rod shape-determining protein MreD [Angustibacter sp.]